MEVKREYITGDKAKAIIKENNRVKGSKYIHPSYSVVGPSYNQSMKRKK